MASFLFKITVPIHRSPSTANLRRGKRYKRIYISDE
jgi:hypothetical protein